MWPGIVKDVKAMVHLILSNGTRKFLIYCVCRMPGVGGAVMIQCSNRQEWFHIVRHQALLHLIPQMNFGAVLTVTRTPFILPLYYYNCILGLFHCIPALIFCIIARYSYVVIELPKLLHPGALLVAKPIDLDHV